MYVGARILIVLNIIMAFWNFTLSGNVIQFSSAKRSIDGVSKSLSKINLAALFLNLITELIESDVLFPQIVQQ